MISTGNSPSKAQAIEELEELESAIQAANQFRPAEIRSLEDAQSDLQTLITVNTAEKDSCWS